MKFPSSKCKGEDGTLGADRGTDVSTLHFELLNFRTDTVCRMLTDAPQTRSGSARASPRRASSSATINPTCSRRCGCCCKPEGYLIDTASSPQQLLRAMELKDYDVVLIDLNYTRDTTSGEEGLDLLQRIHTADESLPVVVMTAWGSVNVAVEAMRRGARDFIQKPWDNERLLSIIRTQTELGRAIRRGRQLEAANQALMADGHSPLLAESAAMRPVLDIIARVGPSDANVLITGENGTGKGLVAQALHAVSPRANRPMVTVNAGGMAEGVFESELFGHMKGAFTDAKVDRVGRFELADGSTLFLDEIANVPLSQQAEAAARHRDRRIRAARIVEDAQGQRAPDLGHQCRSATPK